MNKNSINKQTYTKMNKKSLFVLGFSAALLAGCSSDNVVPNGGDGDLSGDAYVGLSISLPTSNASRAANGNDGQGIGYDTGTADEYNVEDLTVVFFTKPAGATSYEDYTIQKSVSFSKSHLTWATPPAGTGITTYATLPVQKVDKDVCAALVLINPESVSLPLAVGTKYSALNKELSIQNTEKLTDKAGFEGKYFFMSNSPLSDGTVLVDVKPNTRKEFAESNPRPVYVERAVAKVELVKGDDFTTNGTAWDYTITKSGEDPSATLYKNDKVSFTNWALDVTNKKEFPIRKYNTEWNAYQHTENSSTYHYFYANQTQLQGNEYVGNVDKFAFRTYWAIDPNYDGQSVTYTTVTDPIVGSTTENVNKTASPAKDNFNYATEADVNVSLAKAQYCPENTFDVTNMKQGETTRVLLKAVYTPQTNLAEGVQKSDITSGNSWYLLGESNKVNTETSLKAVVEKALNEGVADADRITITSVNITAGKHQPAKAMFEATKNGASYTLSDDDVAKLTNRIGCITAYVNGVCYYVARIQHFGNTYTPWSTDDNYTDVAKITTMRPKYLGRYGVLRNNWYKLTVNSVAAPGSPIVPEIPNENDDEESYYLQTTVQIMDWAVRGQKLDF